MKTFVDHLRDDVSSEELPTAMNDREEWRTRVKKCRSSFNWLGKVIFNNIYIYI